MIRFDETWVKPFCVGAVALLLGIAIWSILGISPEENPEVIVESSSRRVRDSSYGVSRQSREHSLGELGEMVERIQSRLYDVGDSRFDDRLIWDLVDQLRLAEIELLAKEFLLKGNPGSRPWKVAFVARWSELDYSGAEKFLSDELAALESNGDSRSSFVESLTPILALGRARNDLASAWSLLQDDSKISSKGREFLLDYLARRKPEEGFDLLEAMEEEKAGGNQASWESFLGKLPRDSKWQSLALRIEQGGWASHYDKSGGGMGEGELELYDLGHSWANVAIAPRSAFFSQWATFDSKAAMAWYGGGLETQQSRRKLTELISQWAWKKPKAATRWVESEVTGEDREFVFQTIRENFESSVAPKLWLNLSQYLPDQNERFELLKRAATMNAPIFRNVKASRLVDEWEIRRILPQSKLSPAQEVEILKLLKPDYN